MPVPSSRPLAGRRLLALIAVCASANSQPVLAQAASEDTPAETALGPTSRLPQLVGAQYTFFLQNQSTLRSPYAGRLSLDPDGDTQPTNTLGPILAGRR